MKLSLFNLPLNLTVLVNFSSKLPIKSYFQDKLLPLQKNDVQTILPQSERANWKPKCRDNELSKQ